MGSSRRIEKCPQSGWGCMGGGATDHHLEGNHYPVQLYHLKHALCFLTRGRRTICTTTTSTAAVATCRACITPHCTTTWTTTARIHPGALQHHRHLLLTHGGHVEPLKGHCQRRPLCGVEPGLVACLTKPRPVRVDEMPQRRKLVPRRARELLGIVFPVRH